MGVTLTPFALLMASPLEGEVNKFVKSAQYTLKLPILQTIPPCHSEESFRRRTTKESQGGGAYS
jgi:hypothetical protein